MRDNVESLAAEHLRAIGVDMAEFRADMRKEFEQVRIEFNDMKKQFRNLELQVIGWPSNEVVAEGN